MPPLAQNKAEIHDNRKQHEQTKRMCNNNKNQTEQLIAELFGW